MLGKNNQNITNVVGTGAPARPDWTKWILPGILSGIVLMLIILPSTRVSAFKEGHECKGGGFTDNFEDVTLKECAAECKKVDCKFFDYAPKELRKAGSNCELHNECDSEKEDHRYTIYSGWDPAQVQQCIDNPTQIFGECFKLGFCGFGAGSACKDTEEYDKGRDAAGKVIEVIKKIQSLQGFSSWSAYGNESYDELEEVVDDGNKENRFNLKLLCD